MNPAPDLRFAFLGHPRRIWTVPAIHAEVDRLCALHDALITWIRPGDRIVYMGNYTGYGSASVETLEEILTFRRRALSIPGMIPEDIVYLRGAQEELWEKLLQIPFAPDPVDVLLWILGHGLSPTLEAYGQSPHDGIVAAREGIMSLMRWTRRIRAGLRAHAGHEIFHHHLRRAAYTHEDSGSPLLFVHAGLDPARHLTDQGDRFWWAAQGFESLETPYTPFQKVVRGFDPRHGGLALNGLRATLDGGCGFGGDLMCAAFDQAGEVVTLESF